MELARCEYLARRLGERRGGLRALGPRESAQGNQREDTMLTAHENETLACVGPGTHAGTLLRCY